MKDKKNQKPLIEMKDIIKKYYIGEPNELQILQGISLNIYEGEFVAIVGESGSGKSTLMNIIGALDKPTEGSYILDGIDVQNASEKEMNNIRNQKIGFVFQNFNLIGRNSALKNVELPMLYSGVNSKKRTERAMELLEKVGMADRYKHKPNELSGGQKQRVAIARAIVNAPKLLICDEPTGNLDPDTSLEIMKVLEVINNLGTTVIVVTHDRDIVNKMKKRVILLDKGRLRKDFEKGTYDKNEKH